MPIQSTSEGLISLAKGITFTKIGPANGYILKLWAAPRNRNLADNPPVPIVFAQSCDDQKVALIKTILMIKAMTRTNIHLLTHT